MSTVKNNFFAPELLLFAVQQILPFRKTLLYTRLTLNIKKSNYVIFRPHQKALVHQPKLHMFDNEKQSQSNFECKDYVKYLGMLLDKNLSFKNHINQIIIKISKTV